MSAEVVSMASSGHITLQLCPVYHLSFLAGLNYHYRQALISFLPALPHSLDRNLHITLPLISFFHHLMLPSCPQSDLRGSNHRFHSWPLPQGLQTLSFI